ncbi:MAG: hypothetical protein R3C19_09315 [Planctomycetaceae bacterium]
MKDKDVFERGSLVRRESSRAPQDGCTKHDARESGLHYRRRPASGVLLIEGTPTIVYDTVCTKKRGRWLADHSVHQILHDIWEDADAWLMGRYMIMPDHIHFFAAYTGSAIEYENWVRFWKSQFTKRHQISTHRWQSNDWDRRLRTWQQYDEKWEYVRWNPVRHRLVGHPDDWPHQGTVFEFRWE